MTRTADVENLVRVLTRLARGQGLTLGRVRQEQVHAAVPWVQQVADEAGVSPSELVFVYLRSLLGSESWHDDREARVVMAASFGVDPEVTTASEPTPRLADAAQLLSMSTRTAERRREDAFVVLADALLDRPDDGALSEVMLELAGARTLPDQAVLVFRSHETDYWLDEKGVVTKLRQVLQVESRQRQLRRFGISSRYELLGGGYGHAPITHLEGATVTSEEVKPNGALMTDIELHRAYDYGEQFTLVLERRYDRPGEPGCIVQSSAPLLDVIIRLNIARPSVIDRVWYYDEVLTSVAPAAFEDGTELKIEPTGVAEYKTKLIDTRFCCGVNWSLKGAPPVS